MYFSQGLLLQTIQVFKEENGVELSKDEAIRALEALGGLLLAFSDQETTTPTLERSGSCVDLIPYYLNKK